MAKKLNTPSANSLIPRERRIRAIQELYDAVKNGGGGGGGTEDLTPAQKAALNSGITADKLNELETGVSGAVQTNSQSLTESQKSTARNNIGALGTNDVPPVPSGGWAAATDLSALDAYVHSLNTTPVVVGPKPETGTEGTIYRVPGDTTYTDWMYYNGTWNALATYDAATLESQFGYYKWTGTGNAIALTTSNQDAGSPIGSYDIKTGGSFKIKMTNAATGAATLSMNGKTATPLYYNGEAVSASNTWEAGEIISVYYDGTNYQASNSQGGGGKAEKIKYDNSQSGLSAENVQGAIDSAADMLYINDETGIPIGQDGTYYNLAISGGSWVAKTDSCDQKCNFIKVNAGETYKITAKTTGSYESVYAWLTTSNHTAGQPADFLAGYEHILTVNVGSSVKVIVPDGAEYMYIGWIVNGNDRLPSSVEKLTSTRGLSEDIPSIKEEIGMSPYKAGENIFIGTADGYTRYNIDIYNAAYRPSDNPRSIFIPIGNASEITITANSENLSSFALVTEVWDGVSTTIPFADGWSDRRTIPAGETGVVDNMSNASYLCLVLRATSLANLTPASVIVTKTTSKIDLFENEIARIKTKEITINDTELFEELDLHIYGVYGGYIQSNGVWRGDRNRHCIIHVKGGQKVKIKANADRASGVAFLQEAPALVNAAIYCDGTSYIALAAGEVSDIMTVPVDAKYLYYTHSTTNYLDPSFIPTYIKITRPLASLNDASGIATKSASYSPLKPIKSGNEMFTYGLSFYPQAILTRSDIMNRKLVYGWVNKNKGIGVSWMDMFGDTITQFQVGTAASVDDHNPCSVFELQDGRIAAIYTGGHNETTAMRIRITTNANDLTQWEDEFRVEIGVRISYAQVFYVNSYYYIFFRTKPGNVNWGWSYIRSSDFETWESPVAWLSAGTVQYYTKMQKVKDYPNILRVAMYSNPAREDPSIRLGYIDFSNGNIYNGEVDSSKIVGSLGGTAVNYTAFDVVIPKPGGSQRLFDVAYSNLADVKILIATIATSVYNNIRYSIYDNGVIRPMCHGGCGFFGGVYQGGAMFIDENTVVISRNTNDGKTFIPTNTQIDGNSSDQIEIWTWNGYNWKCACVKYSEPVMDGAHPLRNIRPIPCEEKFLMWIRGYYNNDAYTDFDTDAIVTWI